jgi:formate hydrogenlyase subunit 6/NADH:ubiquinone oxidoreductase subunit I
VPVFSVHFQPQLWAWVCGVGGRKSTHHAMTLFEQYAFPTQYRPEITQAVQLCVGKPCGIICPIS